MGMIRFAPYIIAATLAATLFGYVWWLRSENAALTAEVARYERSVAALTEQAAQSREARAVEAARAARWQGRADDLNQTIESILTGDFENEALDPRIADFINGLRRAPD